MREQLCVCVTGNKAWVMVWQIETFHEKFQYPNSMQLMGLSPEPAKAKF